jgi:transcriptional regulator
MFIPKIYRSEDKELMKKIISENAFALLISDKEKLSATHSMFLLNDDKEDFYLETHISKANFQAKVLKDNDEVLCDFLGAHSYISSSWYEKTNVSTWNYEAVQIRGKVKVMTDDELYRHLEKLTYKYEKVQKCPMLVENMGNEFVKKEMKGAFGINIYPTEIFIANKLSQNRNDSDFENIILNLGQSESANDKKIAEKMKADRNLI